MRKLRAAVADIGSNTTLYLLGEVDAKGKIEIIEETQITNGIGKDVFCSGKIREETIAKNIEILNRLKRRASEKGVEKIIFVGTSALRNAENRNEVLQRLEDSLKTKIILISSEEEARMTFSGYLSGKSECVGKILLIDVGGGSSEFILAEGEEIIEALSIELGAVRLMTEFPLGEPPDTIEYQKLREKIPSHLEAIKKFAGINCKMVFSGGTATALAGLKKKVRTYDAEVIENVMLEKDWIFRMQINFLAVPLSERERLLRFDRNRAQVIIGGTAIILGIMELLKRSRCRITHRGLRFGVLADWGRRNLNKSIKNLRSINNA